MPKHIVNNPHALYFNGELIGVITNPDPAGDLYQIAEALSPDDPELVQVVAAGASKPEIEALIERFPVNLRTKVWQIETPIENDPNDPPEHPVYNENGTEIICYTVVPTADQTKAAVSASTGTSEDLIDVQIVSTVEQMRYDIGYEVKICPQHTAEIADGGNSLYYVIRRDGEEIGRSYAGSWDDDFGEQDWDAQPITEERARERMGDEYYDWAVANGKSVRWDLPIPE